MISYLQAAKPDELEAWGRPEDIGAETVTGDILCAGSFDLGGLKTLYLGANFR